MADNAASLHRFYQAFAALDAVTMSACYAVDARFRDPVFDLRGRQEIGAMWSMLCAAVRRDGSDAWSLHYRDVRADEAAGSVHWEAHYRFSATGRLVCNRVDARLRFDGDGRIAEHCDDFDFWRWSRQALGAPGLLLGWSPYLHGKVRAQARARLDRTLSGRPL